MWIERHLSPVLQRAFRQFPVVVLTGARQAGKTSLVRRLFKQAEYVTFDIPRDAETARLDPDEFFARRREPLILDEVQYVPEILRHIKIRVDADRRPGRFILTGSQSFALMQGITESLAGRCAVLALPTLSLAEVAPRGRVGETDEYGWRGGFPELWQRRDVDRDLWLGSYVATYLERDVRNALRLGNLRDFDRFLRAAALQAGQLLSLSALARDVGVAPNTAKAWLSILEAGGQVFLLEPYHRNAGKRLVKTPKLYFSDSGLLTWLLGYPNWPAVLQSAAWGAVWENLVVAEVVKFHLNGGTRPPCWFWRTASGDEVDLLIERGPTRFLAVECKTAARVSLADLKGLPALQAGYGPRALIRAAMVCRTEAPYPLSEGNRVSAVPLGGPEGLDSWLRTGSREA